MTSPTLPELRERAQAADAHWRSTYGSAYRKLHDGRSTARTYSAAADRESRALADKNAADRALRDALLAAGMPAPHLS